MSIYERQIIMVETISKVWKVSKNSYVITIPASVRTVLDLEKGDYVKIIIEKFENETTKVIKEEIQKQEVSKNNELIL